MSNSITPFDPDAVMAANAAGMITDPAPAPDRGMSAPLDNMDKWRLADLAASAYRLARQCGTLPAGETLEQFRRRVSVEACGRRISQATLGDKGRIQSAFLTIKGRASEAAAALARSASTPLAIARNALRRNLRERNLGMAYAESIAARVYKRPVADLETKEVWNIVFNVRTNHKPAAAHASR
jgi:hypothetical protein